MRESLILRVALIQRHCQAEAGSLEKLLDDCEQRAAGVTAFAAAHFPPTLLPATAWVSPLHAPVAVRIRQEGI